MVILESANPFKNHLSEDIQSSVEQRILQISGPMSIINWTIRGEHFADGPNFKAKIVIKITMVFTNLY